MRVLQTKCILKGFPGNIKVILLMKAEGELDEVKLLLVNAALTCPQLSTGILASLCLIEGPSQRFSLVYNQKSLFKICQF